MLFLMLLSLLLFVKLFSFERPAFTRSSDRCSRCCRCRCSWYCFCCVFVVFFCCCWERPVFTRSSGWCWRCWKRPTLSRVSSCCFSCWCCWKSSTLTRVSGRCLLLLLLLGKINQGLVSGRLSIEDIERQTRRVVVEVARRVVRGWWSGNFTFDHMYFVVQSIWLQDWLYF